MQNHAAKYLRCQLWASTVKSNIWLLLVILTQWQTCSIIPETLTLITALMYANLIPVSSHKLAFTSTTSPVLIITTPTWFDARRRFVPRSLPTHSDPHPEHPYTAFIISPRLLHLILISFSAQSRTKAVLHVEATSSEPRLIQRHPAALFIYPLNLYVLYDCCANLTHSPRC